MKNLKTYEWFGKPKEGDELTKKVLDVAKKENIRLQDYRIEIDDKIYIFSNFSGIIGGNCTISIYNVSQKVMTKEYGEIISGKPESRYEISCKLWKEFEKLKKEQLSNLSIDLENLDDTTRAAKKYNL